MNLERSSKGSGDIGRISSHRLRSIIINSGHDKLRMRYPFQQDTFISEGMERYIFQGGKKSKQGNPMLDNPHREISLCF